MTRSGSTAVLVLMLLGSPVYAQSASTSPDSTAAPGTAVSSAPAASPAPATHAPAKPNRTYFGGTLGLTFGSYTSISIEPLVGYILNPKLSVGAKGIYEYVSDTRYSPNLTASNYGGSVFTRLRLGPAIYAHAEYAYVNYETQLLGGGSERNWVPFLYLGGGAVKPIGKGTSAFVEVLFDVLQDSHSPYAAGQPFVSVGVTKGF